MKGEEFPGRHLQVKQSFKKIWIPFIKRGPRDQDGPTRTPPVNSRWMDKATWRQDGDRRKYRDESSRPVSVERDIKFLMPLWSPLPKRWKDGTIKGRPLNSRVGTHKTVSAQKRAAPKVFHIIHD